MRLPWIAAAHALAALLLVAPVVQAQERPLQRDDLIGKVTYHVTTHDDTLIQLARDSNVGLLALSAANPGVDPWVPGAERLITLPTAHLLPDAPRDGLVINLATMEVFYFPPDGGPVQTYPIGVGREGFDTPIGQTRIVRKQEKPTWYPTAASTNEKPWLPKVVPAGPDNPLGDWAMYLGWPTYLLHSTNKPLGVGRRVSHGCIRFYPEGMAALFPQVKVGTRVTTLQQLIKLGWHDGELYIEAHPSAAQLDELESTYTMTPEPSPDLHALILAKAGADYPRVNWRVVEAELVARRGIPTRVTGPMDGVQLTPPPPPATLLANGAPAGGDRPVDADDAPTPLPGATFANAEASGAEPAVASAPAAIPSAGRDPGPVAVTELPPPPADEPVLASDGGFALDVANSADPDEAFEPERQPLQQRIRARMRFTQSLPTPQVQAAPQAPSQPAGVY